MKKLSILLLLIICLLFSACSNGGALTDAATEPVPADYGKSIELAITEFNTVFSEFDGLKIEETTTMARTDDNSDIVIQIAYSSDNGSGTYGFLYKKDASGNDELIEQGEDVTIDNLIKK